MRQKQNNVESKEMAMKRRQGETIKGEQMKQTDEIKGRKEGKEGERGENERRIMGRETGRVTNWSARTKGVNNWTDETS